MKAISTKFIGATNTRGSRVKAVEPDGLAITLSWDHALTADGNHKRAAVALCKKLGWGGELQGGHTKAGMVFAFFDPDYFVDLSTEIGPS